jgi:rubrerythrin
MNDFRQRAEFYRERAAEARDANTSALLQGIASKYDEQAMRLEAAQATGSRGAAATAPEA